MIKLLKTFDTDTAIGTGFNFYEYPSGMSDAMSLQSILTRKGSQAIKVRLRKTDPEAQFGNKRTELSYNNVTSPDSTLRWWRWSTYFPSPYPSDPAEEVIAQWHDKSPNCSASPSLAIEIVNDRFRAAIRSSSQDYCLYPLSRVLNYFDLGPVIKDTWLDWVIFYNPQTDGTGYVKIWLNGTVVLDQAGPCAYIGSQFPYWKLGIYKWSWMPTWSGTASTQTIREYFFDEVMVGDTAAVYGDFLIDSIVIPDPVPTEPPPTSSDLISIVDQPVASSLFAAYRPVVLKVNAKSTNGTAQPPVVYCDIYFGGVYYKTLSKTQPSALYSDSSEWPFDLQDAAQEYLGKLLGENGGISVIDASPLLVKAFCRFRTSGFDSNGFIIAEGSIPVQPAGDSPAISGSGLQTSTFYIVNATLQHDDYQNMGLHLSAFKTGVWATNCYPLTHRPNIYKIGSADSDYFPALVGQDICIDSLAIKYKYLGQSTIRQETISITQPCGITVSNISVNQTSGTQDISATWVASGDATGYVYSIDGGAWIQVSSATVSLAGLSVGSHTIAVAALCQCNQGTIASKTFAVEDPVSYTCSSTVSGVTASQTGEGTASINWTVIATPASYKYRIDGGSWLTVPGKPFTISGLTPQSAISSGSHTIEIVPFCSNGVAGTSGSVIFTVLSLPAISKVSESNTGLGGIRTQTFQIGGNVNPGNRFVLTVYSHDVQVVAVAGDTASSIATKLRNAINATTISSWNSAGSAPATGTNGFPPTATYSGNQLTVTLNYGNSFAYQAYLS